MAENDQPQTPAQNPADTAVADSPPAEPAAPNAPAADPAPAEPAAPAEDAAPPAQDDKAGEQPQQSRQERRNQEREARIRELNAQVKQGGNQPNQPVPSAPQSPSQFDISQYADANGNVDIEAVNKAINQGMVQTADAVSSLRVNQQLAHRDAVSNFERDTELIPTKFDELNPENASYTPELDEAIAQEYKERAFKVVGYDTQGKPITTLDPTVRLADIAARQIKGARAYAAKTSADMKNSVATTADEAAPRPGGAPPAERAFEDLSIEEMEAKLGMLKR